MEASIDIIISTYNHEKYIEASILSAIRQKTSFKKRILVSDDCSTDSNAKIIQGIAEKYPDTVLAFYQKQNLGKQSPTGNWQFLFKQLESKYVALLDGDDYWTDEHKLQKQVDFLEASPEFALCYTAHQTVNGDGISIHEDIPQQTQFGNFSHQDILSNVYFMGTSTVVFRRSCLPVPIPSQFAAVANGDYFLYSMITRNGDAAKLDFISSAYRMHQSGEWTRRKTEQKYWTMYQTFIRANQVFDLPDEQKALKINLVKILQQLSWAYLELPVKERLGFMVKSFFISFKYGVFKTWLEIHSGLLTLFLKNKLKIKTT